MARAVPATVVCASGAAIAVSGDAQFGQSILSLCLGYSIWIAIEYWMHRYLFHRVNFFTCRHAYHHWHPNDRSSPPPTSLVAVTFLAIIVFAYPLTGLTHALVVGMGSMLGYMLYRAIHYVLHHHVCEDIPVLRRLHRIHTLHHENADTNFAATMPMLDILFGTYRPPT